jgi:hypothetical protein
LLGAFRQQTFDEFQTERNGLTNELRIVVRCEGSAAVGERVAELIDGKFSDGAAAKCKCQDDNENNGKAGRIAVPIETLPS